MIRFKAAAIIQAIALVLVFSISACSRDNSTGDKAPPTFSDLSLEQHEARLRERHAARWAAVIRVDFDEVYTFATPEYRRIHSLTHLHNQYGAQIMRRKARIIDLRFDENDPSLAHIDTGLTFATTTPSDTLYEDEILLRDRWRFVDGDWWYVEPR